nr:type II toxin-antitoxin system HicA family toxin [uncultured Methanospirillum sp.]
MSKLPVWLSSKTFSRHGFTKARQTGSHVIMVKHGMDVTLSVPLHDPMKRGTYGSSLLMPVCRWKNFVTLIIRSDNIQTGQRPSD